MKHQSRPIQLIPLLGLVSLLFCHCGVSTVPVEVLVPAEITVSKAVEYVGIINHSLPADRSRLAGIAEAFLTRESIFADPTGAEYCLKGLAEKLNDSPRFTPVVIQGERLTRDGTRSLPVQIPWATVTRICQKYRLDALVALEHFDSDIYLEKHKKTPKKKKSGGGEEETEKEKTRYLARLRIRVSSGWRIYHPIGRRILDAQIYQEEKSWRGSGENYREALLELPDKRSAINEAGYLSGIRYGERISPTWVTLTRSFYTRGARELEEAKRMVRAGDWEGAVRMWQAVSRSEDPELQGKAIYNLAFAAEIRGDLERAVQLAREAYTRYGNRKAYRYLQELQTRIQDQRKLEEQLD